MDVVRLSQVLGWLRSEENSHKLQAKLVSVRDALQSLASNPSDNSAQVNLRNALTEFENAISSAFVFYDPSQKLRMSEIGADPYFTNNIVEYIKAEIASNPMTPASVLESVNALIDKRKEFIDKIKVTEIGLDYFVDYNHGIEPGSSAIGFEIPREIFENEFRDFIGELRVILRIVRVFSEISVGSVPEIKLGKISSSDPLVFLESTPVVIGSIAASVSWILSQWKTFEEIRKIRSDAVRSEHFSKADVEDFFDKKIKEKLEASVEEKVKELLKGSNLIKTRQAELNSELQWAMKSLFARIERGMRVEVQVELLEHDDDKPLNEFQEVKQEELKFVQKIAETLAFPKIESNQPILQITNEGNGETNSNDGE